MTQYCLFDTSIGRCAIAWTEVGVRAVALPERSAGDTARRLVRRHPDAIESPPSTAITEVIDQIVRLLDGEPVDLSTIALDESGVSEFDRRVFAIARTIVPGRTMTYGAIAGQLGDPLLAREVGQALGRNPVPIITPCHRVLAANGKMGGFSAPGGADTKRRMLLIEGALAEEPPSLFG